MKPDKKLTIKRVEAMVLNKTVRVRDEYEGVVTLVGRHYDFDATGGFALVIKVAEGRHAIAFWSEIELSTNGRLL